MQASKMQVLKCFNTSVFLFNFLFTASYIFTQYKNNIELKISFFINKINKCQKNINRCHFFMKESGESLCPSSLLPTLCLASSVRAIPTGAFAVQHRKKQFSFNPCSTLKDSAGRGKITFLSLSFCPLDVESLRRILKITRVHHVLFSSS